MMARIIDKDTRMIDLDFGPLTVSVTRNMLAQKPAAATNGKNGQLQLINFDAGVTYTSGSFVQEQMIDLSFMTLNNEVMQPTEISVQRTSPVPIVGAHENGNNFNPIEEYIYIFTRPLNRAFFDDLSLNYDPLRSLGLDRSQISTVYSDLGGEDAGIPTHEQTVYAEKRIYGFSSQYMASQVNGEIISGSPAVNTLTDTMTLDSISTWGTMSAITGPNLYAYRIVRSRVQNFTADATIFANVGFGGFTTLEYPPVNLTLLCKNPNYTEGEYLTRLANAMNSIPEDGATNA